MTALELILHLAEGSTTPNTLQHITKIAREALAEQPAQQEPLGYIAIMALNDLQASIYRDVAVYGEDLEDTVAIYTTPQAQPAREPLTDERILSCPYDNSDMRSAFSEGWLKAEAAHGITKGNT